MSLRRIILFLGGLLTLIGLGMLTMPKEKPVYVPVDNMVLIAHAGGGLPQGNYSNAREGFDLSAQNNFTLIETDFNWTEDGELVLLRDWRRQHYQYYSWLSFLPHSITKHLPKQPAATSDAFIARKMKHGLHQMRLEDLITWMRLHPNIRIVTDVKDDNLKALALIKASAPDLQSQFIPQIYHPEEYAPVSEMGFTHIIFTAYKSNLSADALVAFANTHKLFALTAPLNKVSLSFADALQVVDTLLFTHTVNSENGAEILRNMNVSGLYTDYLIPVK